MTKSQLFRMLFDAIKGLFTSNVGAEKTADSIVDVFTKTADQLDKHAEAKNIAFSKTVEVVQKYEEDMRVAAKEASAAVEYAKKIRNILN